MKEELYKMPYHRRFWEWHTQKIFKKAVELAKLETGAKVLDFGCNTGELENYLPNVHYLGYDKLTRYTRIESYKDLKDIDAVFCLNVLEHLTEEELANLISDFKRMKIETLVVAFPAENIIGRFFTTLSGMDAELCFEHKLNAKQVARILTDQLGLPKKAIKVNLTQYLAVFVNG